MGLMMAVLNWARAAGLLVRPYPDRNIVYAPCLAVTKLSLCASSGFSGIDKKLLARSMAMKRDFPARFSRFAVTVPIGVGDGHR